MKHLYFNNLVNMYRIPALCLYFSRPGLNWDKTLNVTDIKLDLFLILILINLLKRYKRSTLYDTKT